MDSILMRLSRLQGRGSVKVLVGLLVFSLLVTSYHPMAAVRAETEGNYLNEMAAVGNGWASSVPLGNEEENPGSLEEHEAYVPEDQESNNSGTTDPGIDDNESTDNNTEEAINPGEEADENANAIQEMGVPESQEIMPMMSFWVTFEFPDGTLKHSMTDANFQVTEPLMPREMYPAGMNTFLGWFLNQVGPNEEKGIDFDTFTFKSSATLYARFTNRFIVKFFDADGIVQTTLSVEQYSTLSAATAASIAAVIQQPPGNAVFRHWYEEWTDPNEAVFFPLFVTRNLNFKPYFSAKYYLAFISPGTQIDTVLYDTGQPTVEPQPPTRAGYVFHRWVSQDTGLPFTFGQPISKDTFLVATWTPATANYNVVYWLEKPNFAGIPTPGNLDHYAYAFSETLTATTGETVSMNTMSTAARDSSLGMMFSTVQPFNNTVVVAGNGTTVVNVFCSRDLITIHFDLSYGIYQTSMVYKGTTYTPANPYSFSAKFEQQIGDFWPYSGNATFTNSSIILGFGGWLHNNVTRSNSGPYSWVTQRREFAEDMLPRNAASRSYTLTTNWAPDLKEKTIDYWVQALPAQIPFAKLHHGIHYVRSIEHSEPFIRSSSLFISPKEINGLTFVDDAAIWDHNPNVSPIYIGLYYLRNFYALEFDSRGGSAVPSQSVMFGDELASREPVNPTKVADGIHYTFLGWYTGPDFGDRFDFAAATMPAANLKLFARWESSEYLVRYFYNIGDTVPFHQHGAALNDTVIPPFAPGANVPGRGVLRSWLWLFGYSYCVYNFDLPVKGNVDLYCFWNDYECTITYHGDIGTVGRVPVDNHRYRLGAYAPVLAGDGLDGGSLQFTGWQVDGMGPIYYPGDMIQVTGNMQLYEVRIPHHTVNITYHGNYPDGGYYNMSFDISAPVIPLLDEAQARAFGVIGPRKGYEFLGYWSLTPQPEPTDPAFASGGFAHWKALGLEPNQTQIDLYAQWRAKTDLFKVTYYMGSGTTGAPPIDTLWYQSGDLATVLDGDGLTIDNHYLFAGWQINGAGQVYYPGSVLPVDGYNTVLVARYLPPGDPDFNVVHITFMGNYPDGKAFTIQQSTSSRVTLPTAAEAMENGLDRMDYKLLSWTMQPVPSIGSFALTPGGIYDFYFNTKYPLLKQITFYAQWERIER